MKIFLKVYKAEKEIDGKKHCKYLLPINKELLCEIEYYGIYKMSLPMYKFDKNDYEEKIYPMKNGDVIIFDDFFESKKVFVEIIYVDGKLILQLYVNNKCVDWEIMSI